MKILILSRYQNQIARGAEVFVNELVSRLSKSHNVTVLSGDQADSLQWMKDKYDVVIPINGRLQSLIVSIGRLFKSYKVLISGHSGIGRDDLWNLITRPDIFVALTKKMDSWAKRWSFGVRVVKITNGVDLQKVNPVGEKVPLDLPKPIILSVGAMSWYKHHERTIEAVSRLLNVSLLLIGTGELKNSIEELGRKKLGKRFKLLKARYQDMPNIYRSCDLFTLPSWEREAFGIVYLEAMASNLAVVAPNDDSRREIVGMGGILTNTEDPDHFAASIREALKSDWAKLPREQAEKFDWETIAIRYEKIFLELKQQ